MNGNMQCIIFDHTDERQTIKIRYEDLILDKEKEATEESNKSGIESEEVGSADNEAPQKIEKESMSEIDNDKE